MVKLSQTEAKKNIKEFFADIRNKSPKEIKKMKKLAMSHNIALGNLRKKFCKKCFYPFKTSKVRIKKHMKIIICGNCGHVSRWRINSS